MSTRPHHCLQVEDFNPPSTKASAVYGAVAARSSCLAQNGIAARHYLRADPEHFPARELGPASNNLKEMAHASSLLANLITLSLPRSPTNRQHAPTYSAPGRWSHVPKLYPKAYRSDRLDASQ